MSASSCALIDAVGVCHRPASGAVRIACLVPSITELLFALGLGTQLVARTRFCIHPAAAVAAVPSVGGTKKIKHRLLRELTPSHVILNIDENPRTMAEELASYVPHLIVTHPQAPQDNLHLYRLLGGIFQRQAAAEALARRFAAALAALRARPHPPRRVLYLIWKKPWMAVSPDTYIARTLALVGWRTVPEAAQPRYPAIEITPALLENLDLVLFSSEPYRFRAADLEDFAHDYGCPLHKLRLIDGEMVSWYGSRAIQGLAYLADYADALTDR